MWARGLLLECARSRPMEINRAAFGALAVVGIVAAGGGAYVANRHNQAELMQPAPIYAVPTSGVTETEATITPAAAPEPAPQALVAPPAPEPVRVSKRTSAPAARPSAPAASNSRTSASNRRP